VGALLVAEMSSVPSVFIARCSSHASATATCKQSRPKQEGKDQASDVISDFHAHGSESSLWPIHLARS